MHFFDPYIAIPMLAIGILYAFPTIYAAFKGRNAGRVAFVNLLLGWTIIGWIVAAAWACDEEGVLPGNRR